MYPETTHVTGLWAEGWGLVTGAAGGRPGLSLLPALLLSPISLEDTGNMAKTSVWTEEEVEKLSAVYPSQKSFDEIVIEFPHRSSNAIRLKASRMGLRRPTLTLGMFYEGKPILRSELDGDSKGYIMRCSECGSWIQVGDLDEGDRQAVVCSNCDSFFRVLPDD